MTRFARLVLAAWLLALGVAVAAPAVQPQVLEVVCAGGAMKLQAGDADAPAGAAAMQCPLCQPLAGPLPVAAPVAAGAVPTGCEPGWGTPAPVTRAAHAPLPARGPPAALHA